MNLALFDFDGTITSKDSFLDFIYFATHPTRLLAAKVALSPVVAGYKAGLVPAHRMRAAISWLTLRGRRADDLRTAGADFSKSVIPTRVRPWAERRLEWHREQGDRVVVVSASLDFYLGPWCSERDIELICTRVEVAGDRATGKYVDGDCCGLEKRRRIEERFDVDQYQLVYAYGDTVEDEAMLAMADKPYFRGKVRLTSNSETPLRD
jgi:phosphatidylglycerophosphatase C